MSMVPRHEHHERASEAAPVRDGGEATTTSEIWVYVALVGALILIWSY